MIGYAEPSLHISRGEANDYDLMLFDKVIAYDHLKQKIGIVVNMRTGRPVLNQSGSRGQMCIRDSHCFRGRIQGLF